MRLGHRAWIGDAARIRASDGCQQNHDRRCTVVTAVAGRRTISAGLDALEEQKDLRQLLIHRYKLVRICVQMKNELQHLTMNQGVTKKNKLWSKAGEEVLRELPLRPWANRRREDLKSKRFGEVHGEATLLAGSATIRRNGEGSLGPSRAPRGSGQRT